MKKWFCKFICDYCGKEEITNGLKTPENWKTANESFIEHHSDLVENQEHHSCDNSDCLKRFKEHVESNSLQLN